jgi:outer membrane protein assembly factor BamA
VGGQRVVLRSEHRWLLGGFTKFDNIGIAAFSDAGRMWAGGVPYGQDVSIRVSAGVGLLLAIPKQSRRLMRADFAVPLIPDRNAHYEFRFTISTPFSTLWSEPGVIGRLRSATPATNIFSWP